EQTAEELLAGAQLRRLPFAAVRSPEALLEDPQLADRGFFAPIDGTILRFPGAPFQMSKTPLVTRSDAPRLGSSSWLAPSSPPDLDPLVAPDTGGSIASPHGGGDRRIRSSGGEGPAEKQASRRALDGIRVLDFTHVVAGPIATRILADHGAEVIKVERTVTLDLGERRGGFFGNLNRGKRSLILNMGDPRGGELAKRLAATSDVAGDNFSARVMGNWGLDYEGLRKLRPDIIAIGMSGFGKTGPQKDYVSFGPTLHALCGHTMMMRPTGRDPAGWGFSHSDICGGLNGALAVLAALHHRARTGEGQFIDLSQLESVTAYMGPVLLDLANNGTAPEPVVNRSQEAPGAPHGVYRCAGDDRWVAIAI